MKRFRHCLVLVASGRCPALANQCPLLQAQIDKAVGTRYDASAGSAKSLAQGWALHQVASPRSPKRLGAASVAS